ncbi:MAG: hypothetical protein LRY56_08590 [Burkholderiaceae bacterium]|nr:hypothetical protein [Burkholderiaceae bacterium]
MKEFSENEFLEILRDGVKRTMDFMAHLTEYHGGAVTTEYLLTTDIARAFLSRGHEVRVEKLNRHLVNGLTKRKNWKPQEKIGSRRTDVAVTESELIPVALVEVKIGVNSGIAKIVGDLGKMANLIESLDWKFAKRVRAASVFQVHVAGRANNIDLARLKCVMSEREKVISSQLSELEKAWPVFSFSLEPLMNEDEGFVSTQTETEDDGSEVIGKYGHAIRYYAVVLRLRSKVPWGVKV